MLNKAKNLKIRRRESFERITVYEFEFRIPEVQYLEPVLK